MKVTFHAQPQEEITGVLYACMCPYCGKWIIAFASDDDERINKEMVKGFIFPDPSIGGIVVRCNLVFNPCLHLKEFVPITRKFIFSSPELPEESHE